MTRETRQKQSRSVPRQRKTSSARRTSGAGKTSTRQSVRRAQLQAKTKVACKRSEKPARKQVDLARQSALKDFGTAIRHFQKRDYQKATVLFKKVALGPVREIADRARVHLRLCESKRHHESRPKTAEGYYARGVAALNSREFDQALQYLSKCNKMAPNQEYVHYALAAAYGLLGDSDHAFSHLETAIRLRPQNRVQARHDEDFQGLANDPRFPQLLGAGVRQPST